MNIATQNGIVRRSQEAVAETPMPGRGGMSIRYRQYYLAMAILTLEVVL